jgi:hypothetical protein
MSKLKLTTLANQDDSASVPADTIVSGTAKAWVNFNGTGTVAIRRAFNVSSVTDNGTGQYTVNFTNAMSDVNYSAVGNHNAVNGGGASVVFAYDSPNYYSTTQLQLTCFNAVSAYRSDASRVTVAIFS